ncbi:hypothetical protein P280DRAFT_473727 [Massarina eburnea CBS 473.64]|uniref:Zn(2)-C6 fungal-type domain-containing protein n=1 Tax=Massarina eburnea CBS 473.64 TaxID=1395130 RepID=A0A6A6RM83_9PLEO|nr:hypothetical protein P280DRAFT_473727 [Massarina eburnea CBS 473.64]
MRNPVACVTCRSAKQKCIHNDAPPCDRCKASGRASACEFPPPGTSAIHRRPKRPRQESEADGTPPSACITPLQGPLRVPTAVSPQNSPPNAAATLEGLDPFDLLTDEVKNSYLRCSYKWSFHHTPTLLLRIRDRTLELWMAWAMLALAIRFVREPPAPFKTQIEASNAFAAHARQILQSDLETPSISRVQALLMLTGHDWGAGNGRRAWIYLGMAIRLVEVMDLTQEVKMPQGRRLTREEFIEAEVRRRTAWTCFLMDSLLSGGKGRKKSLSATDMAIQLPCERENFVFGEPVCTEHLDGRLHMPPLSQDVGELGIIAYSMRAASIWGKVSRWACSEELKTELPWAPTSQCSQLIHELDQWRRGLPPRLQYDLFSLHSYNAVEQGQGYCYMHCIHFMSYMFLHRAYLPVLGPHSHSEETLDSYSERSDQWRTWQTTSRRELFKEAAVVLEMLDEMRTFGVFFLRGLVPWIGFTIYTAVGVMLYSYNFPSPEDDPRVTRKARERVIRGCTFLKEMKTQWPMSATWFETIKRMQAYYRSVLGHEGTVSPDERQVLRHAMVDYGALQPTPVQKPADSKPPPPPDTNIVSSFATPTAPVPEASVRNASSLTSTPTPNGMNNTGFNWTGDGSGNENIIPPLEEDASFADVNFNFSNEEMEEIMISATQDFWASFPGEVGVGFQ